MHRVHLKSWEHDKDRTLTEWVKPNIIDHLPYPTSDRCKIVAQLFSVPSKNVETIDSYSGYHIPYKFTRFDELVLYQISLQSRNFVRNLRADFSPFLPGKREQNSVSKNPSLTGQSSTSSTTNSSSTSLEEDSSTEEELNESMHLSSQHSTKQQITFDSVLSSMEEVYGMTLQKPNKESQQIYRTYVRIGRTAKGLEDTSPALANLTTGRKYTLSEIVPNFNQEKYDQMLAPSISNEAIGIYANHLEVPYKYKTNTLGSNYDILTKYLSVETK